MGLGSIESQVVVLFVVMIVGYVARKLHFMNDAFDASLSHLLLNITLPCMLISSTLSSTSLPSAATILTIFGVSCASYIVVIALALAIPRLMRVPAPQLGVYEFMVAFGNVGFIGIPVLSSIYGSSAVLYAAIANIPFNALCFTAGVLMITHGQASSEKSPRTKLGESVRNLRSPALIACVITMVLALLNVTDTGIVGSVFNIIGQITVPGALLVVGSSIARTPFKTMCGSWRPFAVSIARLLVVPLCVYAVFRGFIADPMVLGTVAIITGMPVAANGTLFALEYGADIHAITQGTFVSNVLAIATIPLLVLVVTM